MENKPNLYEGKILVVDDDEMICQLLRDILNRNNMDVVPAYNAKHALEELSRQKIDVVLTDVNMPGMNGIVLMEEIKKLSPDLPVIIMTGGGTEEIAVKALQRGALNFCRKPFNIPEISSVIKKGLEAKKLSDKQKEIMHFLVVNFCFDIPSDVIYIKGLIHYIYQGAKQLGFPENEFTMRVRVAIDEAIVNAIRHGNKFDKNKRVKIDVTISPDKLQVKIIDEGNGFDVSAIPDPKDPENLHNEGGRGVLLMGYYMDEIKYNDKGNEVVLTKYAHNHEMSV